MNPYHTRMLIVILTPKYLGCYNTCTCASGVELLVCPPVCPPVCWSICLFVCLSACPSVFLPVCPPVLSVCSSVCCCLSVHLSAAVYLFICLSVCLSVHLSVHSSKKYFCIGQFRGYNKIVKAKKFASLCIPSRAQSSFIHYISMFSDYQCCPPFNTASATLTFWIWPYMSTVYTIACVHILNMMEL